MLLASLMPPRPTLFQGPVARMVARAATAFMFAWLLRPATAVDQIDFDQQIKPLLSDRCFICHGPDAEKREADLRLDLEASAKDHAIVPGKPDASELVARIKSDDPDAIMPPPNSKLSLSQAEQQLIETWIKQGAPWKEHWSFAPPQRIPAFPEQTDPWRRNEIDGFVLRRMRTVDLEPSDAAPKELLIRRASFDITGLPPTRKEVQDFLEDPAKDAFEKVVDRLLSSDRYGERMAASWLDVARYSDTYGYQVDRDRYVWPWRDWVVKAFNQNQPYDQFITEQLAGDLLPNASHEQLLATTFNRLHPQKVEGGSTPEEFRVEYVADRSQTAATALLGLTMECCRCHDHKYDPLSQREYYQLTAFFDNIDEAGLYSFFTSSVPTPTLALADDATRGKLAKLRHQVELAEQALQREAESSDARARFQAWQQKRVAREHPTTEQATSSETRDEAINSTAKSEQTKQNGTKQNGAKQNGATQSEEFPGQVAHLAFEDGKVGGNTSVEGKIGKGVRLTGDDAVKLSVGNFRRFQPFSVALWLNTPDEKERAVVFHRSRAWTDAGSRGYQLLIEDGRLSASLIHFWPGNAIRLRTKHPLPVRKWLHVVWTYDGSSSASGLQLYIDGQLADCDVVRNNLYKNITGGGGDNLAIGERFRDRGFKHGLVDEFRVFDRQLTALEAARLFRTESLAPEEIQSAVSSDNAKSFPSELFDYYVINHDAPFRKKRESLGDARKALCELEDGLQEIMVMRERSTPRPTYLLKRGAYDARGERVQPGTPSALGEFPANAPANRLGLANWLCSPNHPLTSRVAVNRIWQLMMGHGIVRTPEDFGRQGQPPTHPELLDWLAVDFVEHDWDVKRLVKQIAMSATYQQSSASDPQRLSVDPENRYWSRAEAFRLPAEMLRDQALLISGLLVEKLGGAPVKPYELEASFKPSRRDKGEGLYRRSLYTYWKRTGPAPMMMVLDSAKRDVCRVKRERTATPLQAFVMMNSPQFVEAARVLAERLIREFPIEADGKDTADRDRQFVTAAFQRTAGRKPQQREVEILIKLLKQQRERFASNPEHAKQYRSVGDAPVDDTLNATEAAASTALINTLLNYDETLMRR